MYIYANYVYSIVPSVRGSRNEDTQAHFTGQIHRDCFFQVKATLRHRASLGTPKHWQYLPRPSGAHSMLWGTSDHPWSGHRPATAGHRVASPPGPSWLASAFSHVPAPPASPSAAWSVSEAPSGTTKRNERHGHGWKYQLCEMYRNVHTQKLL